MVAQAQEYTSTKLGRSVNTRGTLRPVRAHSSSSVAGRTVPSRWTWTSALGSAARSGGTVMRPATRRRGGGALSRRGRRPRGRRGARREGGRADRAPGGDRRQRPLPLRSAGAGRDARSGRARAELGSRPAQRPPRAGGRARGLDREPRARGPGTDDGPDAPSRGHAPRQGRGARPPRLRRAPVDARLARRPRPSLRSRDRRGRDVHHPRGASGVVHARAIATKLSAQKAIHPETHTTDFRGDSLGCITLTAWELRQFGYRGHAFFCEDAATGEVLGAVLTRGGLVRCFISGDYVGDGCYDFTICGLADGACVVQ